MTSLNSPNVLVVSLREKVKLKFPHHFYFLEENKLRSYSLATKESIDLQSFRPASTNQVTSAQVVIYSPNKRTWLVFFRKSGSNEKEQWVYTLIREGEVGAIQPWFAPGENSLVLPRLRSCWLRNAVCVCCDFPPYFLLNHA